MLYSTDGRPAHDAMTTDGFVIIDNLIKPELLEPLRQAAERVIKKARDGEWKERRLVGTPFPPWNEGTDVWGVQHLLNPELGEPVFAEWYGSEEMINAVCELLEVKPEELQLELFNMLVNPQDSDFDLPWHRDAIKPKVPADEERELLKIPHYGTQWNTALYDESCLFVVPASHHRIRTAEEREITVNDPLSRNMPDQLQVHLKAGQTVFYNNNILHRAIYYCANKRATLHASFGSTEGGHHRAANIFQHGLDWMNEDRFVKTLPPSLETPYKNLQAMSKRAQLEKEQKQPVSASA
ncbi:hypothetical protein K450DRAFT_228260 [Umbelopsis ramanniana AG]|uniref:Phytanoyl-CoA dioxygenase family protein n=1 Tax=Umbelopsis ramanniana AG TaxID=1314678 RepID=A0AAD5EFK0_UMBRA|nr:uncharacterized protein K450DRAFT_228260 [Umbelopsis ramanniana AG]KAI8582289.1 hypothetical protein K450DRAFT_228260 [Umbelopsis ramanniana AG]